MASTSITCNYHGSGKDSHPQALAPKSERGGCTIAYLCMSDQHVGSVPMLSLQLQNQTMKVVAAHSELDKPFMQAWASTGGNITSIHYCSVRFLFHYPHITPIDIEQLSPQRPPSNPVYSSFHCIFHLILYHSYMGGCQNYGPFSGTLNIRCRIRIGIQKGTLILTTTHITYIGVSRTPSLAGMLRSGAPGCWPFTAMAAAF